MPRLIFVEGADPTLENENGHKPEAYARNGKVLEVLKKSSKEVRYTISFGLLALCVVVRNLCYSRSYNVMFNLINILEYRDFDGTDDSDLNSINKILDI